MRLNFIKSAILCLTLLSVSALPAADTYNPEKEDALLEPWRWQHYSYLSGKGLRSFTEDINKNMWFGVDEGVIKYDGFKWISYTEEDGIYGCPVQILYASKNGHIYAGSEKGLSVFNGKEWHTMLKMNDDLNLNVHSIKELSDQSLAIATDYGLITIKENKKVFYVSQSTAHEFKNKFPDLAFCRITDDILFDNTFNIYDFLQDDQDRLWISLGMSEDGYGKIVRFSVPEQPVEAIASYEVIKKGNNIPFGSRMHFLQDEDQTIWIISADHNRGIFKYNGQSWEYFLLSEILGGDDLHVNIISTKDGAVWIGGLGKLYSYNNNHWKMYKAPEVTIPPSRILLKETAEGHLWIGGQQNEVYSLDYAGLTWETFKNLNFQCEQQNGVQWFVSVDDKVVKKDKNSWTYYSRKDGLMDQPVTLISTSKGQVWAAGSHKGVASTAYFENGKWHKQIHEKLSWGIDYRAVYEATDGSIWFGTGVDIVRSKGQIAGVLRLVNPTEKNKKWIHYTGDDGIQQKNAYGIAQSPDGKIWIGGTALLGFDGEKWTKQTEPAQLAERVDNVQSRSNGNLWVGSRFYGLFRYDGSVWQQFTVQDGLLSNTIISIYAESENNVWVATDKDIARFDGHNWTTNVFPSKLTFTREGGSLKMSSEGTLWINKSLREWKRRALNSVTLPKEVLQNFYTVRYKADRRGPDTNITFYIEEVDDAGNVVVEWTGHDAWDVTPKEQITYSYRLNDGEWSPFTLDTHASFKQLASGDYTFEVRARDKDFNIDASPEKVNFEVLQPVYLRAWFLVLMSIMLGIIVYLTTKLIQRNINLRKTNSKLEDAKKETDDILNNVDEGLFLLNMDLIIGSQYSTVLEKIFNTKKLAQTSLVDILQNKISDHELSTVKDYLEIAFRQNIDLLTIDDLNPLSEIRLDFKDPREYKYLSFKFRRVDKDSQQELIVTVQDITAQVELEQKLKKSEEESKRQMNWLLSILHVEPKMLQDFLSVAQRELENTEKIITEIDKTKQGNYKNILVQIYRSMHLLKGNASLLALNFFSDQVHKFESKISDLQKEEICSKKDLKSLNKELSELKITLDEVNKLLDKISSIHSQMKNNKGKEEKLLTKSLENLVESTSEDVGKKIKLNMSKFDKKSIPENYKLMIREILVQLIRNSIAHGIEKPEDRKKLKKPVYGTIEILSEMKNKTYHLSVRDDGQGININSLKKSLKEKKIIKDKELEKWSQSKLAEAIFVSGITTAENTSMVAGRGVGLDAVKEKIEKNNGEIKVDYKEGKYCQFDILLHTN